MNYAALSLAETVRACAEEAAKERNKLIISSAKMSASIPALLAHAHLTAQSADDASQSIWAMIRSDVHLLADRSLDTNSAVNSLRLMGPLWPDAVPEWAGFNQGSA